MFVASHDIVSNFFEEQCSQNHPQYLSGLSCALFPTTFLEIAVGTGWHSKKQQKWRHLITVVFEASWLGKIKLSTDHETTIKKDLVPLLDSYYVPFEYNIDPLKLLSGLEEGKNLRAMILGFTLTTNMPLACHSVYQQNKPSSSFPQNGFAWSPILGRETAWACNVTFWL